MYRHSFLTDLFLLRLPSLLLRDILLGTVPVCHQAVCRSLSRSSQFQWVKLLWMHVIAFHLQHLQRDLAKAHRPSLTVRECITEQWCCWIGLLPTHRAQLEWLKDMRTYINWQKHTKTHIMKTLHQLCLWKPLERQKRIRWAQEYLDFSRPQLLVEWSVDWMSSWIAVQKKS